jgi:hypothetical protein
MQEPPSDIILPVPAVEKIRPAAVEPEPVDPCCSRAMSFACFGFVGISFFVIFVTITSVMVFGNGYEFCNGYVSLFDFQCMISFLKFVVTFVHTQWRTEKDPSMRYQLSGMVIVEFFVVCALGHTLIYLFFLCSLQWLYGLT